MKLAFVLGLGVAASVAQAETFPLSEKDRKELGRHIREVLLAEPEIVERALNPSIYQDDIDSDLDLIKRHAATLFAGGEVALIMGQGCPDCATALSELRALAEAKGADITVLDAADHPALTSELGVDTLPFYVFPDMMLRGAMPATVLERYLSAL